MIYAYLHTFLWACAPLVEMRASIPLGYLQYGLSIYEATLVSCIGIIFATTLVRFLLPHIVNFADRHWPFFDRILQKIFARTRAKHSHRAEVLGEVALIAFIAIPLPGSGAWTGVLLAYLFGIPFKKSILVMAIGVLLSGIIIACLTLFGHNIWEVFAERA